jgi:CRP-like cAMP-binding protein
MNAGPVANAGRPLALTPGLVAAVDDAFPHGRVETRHRLAGSARVRSFEAGEVIIEQGDATSLALVIDGHVAVRRTTVDGREIIVRIVRRSGLAGILPLAARPASGTSVALTAGSVAMWQGDDVRSLALADSGLAIDILDQVLGAFERIVSRLDGMLHQAAVRRVARVLVAHADLFFVEPPVLPRSALPDLVGTSREMTGRVLRALESRELVSRVGRNGLRLVDAAGLEQIADLAPERPEASDLGGRRSAAQLA